MTCLEERDDERSEREVGGLLQLGVKVFDRQVRILRVEKQHMPDHGHSEICEDLPVFKLLSKSLLPSNQSIN